MRYFSRIATLALYALFTSPANSQKNTLAIGANIVHFKDWKDLKFFNFFNPEVAYIRKLNSNLNLSASLNVFYAQLSKPHEGTVNDRLIFSNDNLCEYLKRGFFVGAGPTLRYRREKTISSPEYFNQLIFSHHSLDVGGILSAGCKITMTKKSLVIFKVSYRVYNRGVNPASLGIFYGLAWN